MATRRAGWRLGLLALTALATGTLLPLGMGGATSYVNTFGSSMEPQFHAGDLAVVREAGRYDVGDVVAYQSPELDRIVLHRIVERRETTFAFKGDNNDFVDPEWLGADRILGRLVVRVPRGGQALRWLGDPGMRSPPPPP